MSFNFLGPYAGYNLTMSANTGNASITVDAGETGTIQLGAAAGVGSGYGNLILSSNLDVVHNGSGQLQFNRTVSGPGGITKTGTGNLILTGGTYANTYSGLTTVSAGSLTLSKTAGTDAIAGNVLVNGGTLLSGTSNNIKDTSNVEIASGTYSLGAFSETVNGVKLTGGSITATTGALTSTTAYDLQSGSSSAILAGSVGANKTTAGTVTLSGAAANTYSGLTTVSGGVLSLGKTSGVDAIAGDVLVTGSGTLSSAASNQIKDTSSVEIATGGTWSLGVRNETVNNLKLTGGTITSTGTLTSTTAYDLQSGSASAILAGTAGANKTTSGSVLLTGLNTLTGNVNVSNGTLEIYANNTNAPSYNITGGKLLASYSTATDINTATSINLNGGMLHISTNGTAKTYDKAPIVVGTASKLSYENTSSSTTQNLNISGSTGPFTLNGDLTVQNISTNAALNNYLNISRNVTGTGSMIVETNNNVASPDLMNTGRVTLTGSNTGWSGDLVVRKGTVLFGSNATASSGGTGKIIIGETANSYGAGVQYSAFGFTGTNQTINNDIIVRSGGYRALRTASDNSYVFNGGITLEGDLTVNNANYFNTYHIYLNGNISGAGGLTISESGGTVGNAFTRLTGSNTYSGDTIISSSASLNIASASGNAIGDSSAVSVGAGSDLTFNSTNETIGSLASSGTNGAVVLGNNTLTTGGNNQSTSFGGVISGTGGGLTKTGNGTMTLTGSNSYTGATTITGGTLKVNGTLAIGSAVAVNSTGRLAGTGNVNGTVSINSGGTIAPGNSPGTLNTGATTYNSGGNYQWEINKVDGTLGADPGWDLHAVTGTLDVQATSGSTFAVNIAGLNTSNSAGNVANWNPATSGTWTIATSTTLSNFAADKFTVGTANFANNNALLGGNFTIGSSGNNIQLTFNPSGSGLPQGLGIFASDNANISGFGYGAWSYSGGGSNSGTFTGDANANGSGALGGANTNGKAYGFWAKNGAQINGFRTFNSGLPVGRTFSLDVDNGYINNGSTVGYALRNSSAVQLFEIYFAGGGSAYQISTGGNTASPTYASTGIGFTDKGLHVEVTLTSGTTYTATISAAGAPNQTFTGNLITPSSGTSDVADVRVYNVNAGSGSTNDAYFNSPTVVLPTWNGQSVGSGGGTFSNGSNWAAHAPVNGGSIAFDGTGSTVNNNLLTSVYNIAFNATGNPATGNNTTNAGAYTLTGSAVTINGGIDNNSTNLQTINNNLTLGASQSFNATNGALTLGGSIAMGGKYLTVNAANGVALNGNITGNGDILKSGSGTLTLAGSNTFTGTGVSGQTYGQVFITNGTVRAATNNALGTQAGGVSVDLGDSNLGQTGVTNYSTNVSLLANSGVTIGNQLYVAVNTGGATRTIGSDGTTGAVAFTGNVLLTGSAILTSATGGDVTMSGTLGTPGFTAGGITKTGAGKVTLTASNGYTGLTTISSGTLVAGNDYALGTGLMTLDGGNLASDNNARNFFNPVVVNANSINGGVSGSNDLTFSGGASGTGTLVVKGTGKVTVAGAVNSFSPTEIQVNTGGTLLLGGSNKIGNTTAVNLNGGTFNTAGNSEVGTVSLSSTTNGLGTLTLSQTSTLDFGTGASVVQFSGIAQSLDGTVLTILNWSGTPNAAGGTDRLLFSGQAGTFTGLFGQNEVSFNGVSGYKPIQFGSDAASYYYEITAVPEPATIIGAFAFLGLIVLRERRQVCGLWAGLLSWTKPGKV